MDPFPDDVRQFLEGNIDCLEQLETLRILESDPTRQWKATAIAREVQASPEAMAAHLAALHARGLILLQGREANASCQYGPRTPELERAVARLLELYQQRPVTMIRMVYDRAGAALKTFADAFRLRKKEE